MGEMRNVCEILVTNPEKSRRSWEDNIRIYLKEIGWEFADWNHLAQNRGQWRVTANTVTNFRFTHKVMNFMTS
jgi:hypothetical protein